MNKADKPLKARVIEVVLTVATVIVIFITIAFAAAAADSFRYYKRSPYGESTYKYALENGEYAKISVYVKEAENYEQVPREVQRYFGIGRYFYAGSMAELAYTLNDADMIEYWTGQREQLRDKCGDLSGYTVQIDEALKR